MTNKVVLPGLFVFLLCLVVYHDHVQRNRRKKFPPGPKGLPILGNIRDRPPKGKPEFSYWMERMKKFGPVSSITTLGQTIVFIHDRQAAYEILERTTKKSSGRPYLEFGDRLCGFNGFIATMQFDDDCKLQRRMIHQHLGTKSAVARFHDIMEEEVKIFMLRIWREPGRLIELFKGVTGAIILKVIYGYTVDQDQDDCLVQLIHVMMTNFLNVFVAMKWLVDIVPWIQYLPSRLPGMGFKKFARRCRQVNRAVADIPYSFARRQSKGPDGRPCYVSKLVEELGSEKRKAKKEADREEKAIKYSAGILFLGGADTTASSMASFTLAMTLYPDVQRRAQEEIDGVIGLDRIPRLDDRPNLPYVDAIVKEALRWMPVAPLGNVHRATEDIMYRDYVIPKGSFIIPSVWWLTHDPEAHRNPDAFDPERFITGDEPDPHLAVFGFGRRKCPGQYFADESLFLMISNLLSCFELSKAVDEKGREIEPPVQGTPGLICRPIPFPYRIKPRAGKEHLLRAIEAEKPLRKSDSSLVRDEIQPVLRT
ncbi:hypothetical protein CP533_1141 [Ophiocordyceps camponoti-saundersi (nom. inval.)]|nr:hypothetical protein CP533_1141 [Ophiocordyceps camponoti-saundersi (nom. inval.)]